MPLNLSVYNGNYPRGIYIAENGKGVELTDLYMPKENTFHALLAPPGSIYVGSFMAPAVDGSKTDIDSIEADPSIWGCGYSAEGKALFHPNHDRSDEKWDLKESLYDRWNGQRARLDEILQSYRFETCWNLESQEWESWATHTLDSAPTKIAVATGSSSEEAYRRMLSYVRNHIHSEKNMEFPLPEEDY